MLMVEQPVTSFWHRAVDGRVLLKECDGVWSHLDLLNVDIL